MIAFFFAYVLVASMHRIAEQDIRLSDISDNPSKSDNSNVQKDEARKTRAEIAVCLQYCTKTLLNAATF